MSVEGCTHKGQDESYSTIYGEHNGGSYWSGSRNGRLLNKLAKGYVEREAETECDQPGGMHHPLDGKVLQ